MRKRLGTPAIRIIRTQPRGSQEIEKRGNDDRDDHVRVISPFFNSLLSGALGPMQGMGLTGILEWRLQAADGGTRITLWYRAGGYSPDDLRQLAPVVDRVQGLQLGGLANYLIGRSGKAQAQKP